MSGENATEPILWRVHIPVEPARVFDALDSAQERAQFWAVSAEERDGAIEFRFSDGTPLRAPIRERKRPSAFALEYFGGLARFAVSPDGRGGSDVVLTHENVPKKEWLEAHAGWLNVLLPMKAWIAHGVDLRNHDPARTWRQRYVDQ